MVLPCVPGLAPGRALRTVVMMTGPPLGAHGSLGKGWKLSRRWGGPQYGTQSALRLSVYPGHPWAEDCLTTSGF